MREVEDSLRRLGTDWIDLYQIHRPDPDTDIDETLGALTDLVRAGKVRYVGHSTFPASAIVEAQWTAQDRGRERFRSEQPPYSILTRGIEAEVLPTCQRYGMGVIPYSPLAGGWLSGRYRKDADVTGPMSYARQRLANRFDMSLPENQRKLEAAEQLAELADHAGLTLVQLAIAFVLRHPAVTAPIIGPRTMEHLESQLAAADVTLSGDVLDQIDKIVPPGVNLNPADGGWVSPALNAAARRREDVSPGRPVDTPGAREGQCDVPDTHTEVLQSFARFGVASVGLQQRDRPGAPGRHRRRAHLARGLLHGIAVPEGNRPGQQQFR
jgi:aryl-alcohol dehydrogenase-like predicted oxidoreductase